ncbi:ribonuclease H-like domain-containing protein [Tanacetum coccineum]
MDDGVVNWGEHTVEEEDSNHALMAISSNNEIGEQEVKILAYDQAVKKLEAQVKIVDSWKKSSKNLWKLVDSGMSSTSKVDLGYEIKSNDEVLSYEEEMNRTVFNCTKEDFVDKPLYSRFSKTDNFKGRPQKPETSISDDKFSENYVTSNEEVVSAPKPKEAEPSCVTHVKTPKQPMKNQGTPKVNGKNWNEMMERELGEDYSFIKKKCFVCGSLSHLIRDCNFYEKKWQKQRVFNTGNGVAKPVWNNAKRVNHANHFVPRPVQLIAVRQNVNSVRSNVNTGSFNVNTAKTKQPIHTCISNSFSPVIPQVNKFNQRSNFSKSHSPVRRPIVRNTAKLSYTHAVKGN